MPDNRMYPVVRFLGRTVGVWCIFFLCSGRINAQQLDVLREPAAQKLIPQSKDVNSSEHPFSILKMTGTEPQLCHNVLLRNTGCSPVTITDVDLISDEAGIGVTSVVNADLPVTVRPGGTMTVRLRSISPDHEFRSDTLILLNENGQRIPIAIGAKTERTDADELGLGRREITMTVTPNAADRSININLYRYVGEIGIYTMSGQLVDIAKNVRSYVWHATRKKKYYDEQEYVVRVRSTDGGYSFSRTEHVSFVSQ